jgi:hypothetical protein
VEASFPFGYSALVTRLSGETVSTWYRASKKVAVGDSIVVDEIPCVVTKVRDPRPKMDPGSLEADETLIGPDG